MNLESKCKYKFKKPTILAFMGKKDKNRLKIILVNLRSTWKW